MIWFLIFTNVLLAGALVYACHKIEKTQEESRNNETRRAGEYARLAHRARARKSAILREAADDYERASTGEDAEGRANLNRIGREEYRAGGPNVPTLWLLDRAATLDKECDNHEHTFDGGCL